ncbi:MAG: hypothetical protein MJ198_02450 [Bacteroidales bacterium]|nr:hypothetical protein [Bacteroidales bacterium]
MFPSINTASKLYGSDPYIFTATNKTTGTVYKTTVSANSNKTLSNCETGSYTVSYEQASGYLIYATTGSWDAATLDDGYIRTYTLK